MLAFLAHRLAHYFLPRPSNNHKSRFLHPSPIFYLAGAFALIQLILNRPTPGQAILGYASDITPQAIIELTNQKRQDAGIGVLRFDVDLVLAAGAKARDMIANNYWAHVSPTGVEPWFFITQANYKYLLAGENLARDFNDSVSVVEAWMNSPTHRANLLNPKYQDIGVAVQNGSLSGIETTLVVQMFGTRLEGSPSIDADTKSEEPPPPLAQVQAIPTPTPPLPSATPTPILPSKLNLSVENEDFPPSSLTVARVSPSPLINPFQVTRGLASFILLFLLMLFFIDVIIINKNKIVRFSSDSIAHIIFLLTITATIWLINSGVIL